NEKKRSKKIKACCSYLILIGKIRKLEKIKYNTWNVVYQHSHIPPQRDLTNGTTIYITIFKKNSLTKRKNS
ncbi:hypothetical protein PanWU01x14_063670, partial [Parasponia andersonii]